MVLKNQAVFGSVNASRVDFKKAIGDLVQFSQQWSETTKSLITGRYSMKSYTELLTVPAKRIMNVLTISQ
jgi:hypothetical protein